MYVYVYMYYIIYTYFYTCNLIYQMIQCLFSQTIKDFIDISLSTRAIPARTESDMCTGLFHNLQRGSHRYNEKAGKSHSRAADEYNRPLLTATALTRFPANHSRDPKLNNCEVISPGRMVWRDKVQLTPRDCCDCMRGSGGGGGMQVSQKRNSRNGESKRIPRVRGQESFAARGKREIRRGVVVREEAREKR